MEGHLHECLRDQKKGAEGNQCSSKFENYKLAAVVQMKVVDVT